MAAGYYPAYAQGPLHMDAHHVQHPLHGYHTPYEDQCLAPNSGPDPWNSQPIMGTEAYQTGPGAPQMLLQQGSLPTMPQLPPYEELNVTGDTGAAGDPTATYWEGGVAAMVREEPAAYRCALQYFLFLDVQACSLGVEP